MNIYYYKYEDGEFTVKPIEVKETEKLYRVKTRFGYSNIKKTNIGVATGAFYYTSASVYLLERDDERARGLFFGFFDGRITETFKEKERIEKRISDIAEAQDKLLKTNVKEMEEKENE